jgi:hypothetical protein
MFEIVAYIVGFLFVSFCFVVFFGAPYVPTLKSGLADIFALYPLTNQDVVVDIGSGDGVILRALATKNIRAIGYELNPWLYATSKLISRKDPYVSVHLANFWHAELPSETTVVYAFLNGRYMKKLQTKLQTHVNRTQKPLHFISYGFAMPGQKIVTTHGPMHLYIFQP